MTPSTSPTELARQLDRSFGDGPATVSPVDHLTSGRRSLRRRRGAVALAATAAVAALGTVTLIGLDSGGPGTTSGIPVAGQGTDPTTKPTVEPPAEALPAPEGHTITDVWIQDGSLYTGSAVEVIKRIDDLLGTSAASFALSARVEGKEFYYLLVEDDLVKEPAKTSVPGKPAAPGFEQWLATSDQAGGALSLVRFGNGDVLEPVADGRTIVEQTREVDLPDNFAGPDELTAAATVDFAGERWFVLARQGARGPADYIVFARDGEVRTLEQFLAYSKDRYASGEGLR